MRETRFFPGTEKVFCEFSHDSILEHLIFQCFFPFGIQHWFSIHLVALAAWSSPKYRGVSKCDDWFFPANLGSRAPFVSLERVDTSPPGPVLEGDVDDEERSAPSRQLKLPVPVTSVGCGSHFADTTDLRCSIFISLPGLLFTAC